VLVAQSKGLRIISFAVNEPARLVAEPARCDHGAMLRVTCLLLAFVLSACASQRVVDRFDGVAIGMTKDEVVALLGKPSSRWALSHALDGMNGERLQWGDGLSSLASSAVYRGKPDRAYCVDFDDGGRVISKAPPVWVERTEQ
jgi:hypothetical protein